MHPAEYPIGERDERKKRNEHGGNVEHQVQALAGTARGCVDDIHSGLLHLHLHAAFGFRMAVFGNEDLGQHDSGRRRHDDGREQVLDVDMSQLNVGHHHGAGNVRHAAYHDGEQFAFGEVRQKRANRQRSFGLPHEYACGYVGRFRAAGAHHAVH